MRYHAVASDYDGTLAQHGRVSAETVKALERLRQSGRKLVLVTGREIRELEQVFDCLNVFDRVVAENGAVILSPRSRQKHTLASPPPPQFLKKLNELGVHDISVGDVIVATWRPYETAVLEAIRDCGLELHLVFNKDAVMVLPSGINKMTGLTHAIHDLGLSRHNLIGIGDAENDHAFLSCCECAVAVANAIPSLKDEADLVTRGERGQGVEEVIESLLVDDLASLRVPRHGILLGRAEEEKVCVDPYGTHMLVSGSSGSGKSTFVSGLLERLLERDYQVCLIDPEGDYENARGCITVGDEQRPPSFEQVMQTIDHPEAKVIVNLIGIKMRDRPGFFASLTTKLQEKNLQHGRPYWLIVDEAHHMFPSDWAPSADQLAAPFGSTLLVTVHPEHVSPAALKPVNVVVVVGKEPGQTLAAFARTAEAEPPQEHYQDLAEGEVAVWFRDSGKVRPRLKAEAGRAERRRHRRKYAEGELEPERIFYFRGPENKLNIRIQNLNMFLQVADGVDDETWLYHLRREDYSAWFRFAIKDKDVAERIASVEHNANLSPRESRAEIAKAIEERYTAPS
jgi:hydroxymethylpyrimidine pyrophosphatase-like HAD family hydrolase